MRTQSEPPGPSIDGGDQQSFHSSPTISAVTAISGRSSLGMGLQYKGAWCTVYPSKNLYGPPGRLPSTVDLDTVHPFDKGKKIPQRPVRISAWKLAKLDSNEAVKAGAKARASSSSVDYLSSSNVSGRNSPTSTNQGFRGRNARSASESSYPPSRTSREDIKSISNLSSPLPPNLALSPLEQRTSNADHFNPMYQSSENQSPWSAKVNDGNETVLSDNVAQVPMRRNNLGVAENTRPSVYWDQEAGRFVTAATRNVNSSSSQVPGTELTYTGQSIFFGGLRVLREVQRQVIISRVDHRRDGQLSVFVPSDSQQHQFSSRLP